MKKILFNSINPKQKIEITKKIYSKKLFFQEQVIKNKYFKSVDISEYAIYLRLQIIRLLQEKKIVKNNFNGDLENLHKYVNKELKNYHYGTNKLSSFFYNTDKKFKDTYIELIKFLKKK